MSSKAQGAGVALLVSLVAVGCDQVTQGQPIIADGNWDTYTSPEQLVSFDYPAGMHLTVRPRRHPNDPQLALSIVSLKEKLDVTLIMRLSVDELPDYCQHMMDSCLDDSTRSLTPCEEISHGGRKGLRQEFRSGSGWQAREFIALALEAEPAYVHFTAGYSAGDKSKLRPICERIVDSLKLKSP